VERRPRGDLIAGCNCLSRGWKEDGAELFLIVTDGIVKDNGQTA